MSGSALSFHTSEAPCPISCIEAVDRKVETLPLIAYAVFWEGLLLIMFCVFAHVHTFMDVSLGVSLSSASDTDPCVFAQPGKPAPCSFPTFLVNRSFPSSSQATGFMQGTGDVAMLPA